MEYLGNGTHPMACFPSSPLTVCVRPAIFPSAYGKHHVVALSSLPASETLLNRLPAEHETSSSIFLLTFDFLLPPVAVRFLHHTSRSLRFELVIPSVVRKREAGLMAPN